MAGRRGFLRRGSTAPSGESPAAPIEPTTHSIALDASKAASASSAAWRPAAPPLPRAPTTPHHWLTLLVARAGPHAPVPVPGARVQVRWFPRGSARPLDVRARGTTGADGTLELQLPAGRYAVSARTNDEAKVVTVTLEHAGRALLLLESVGRRVTITTEVARADGRALGGVAVEARATPGGSLAATSITDERGVASLELPPGAYEIHVGTTMVRTYAEADTLLRLTAEAPVVAEAPALSRYAQKVRQATSYVAPYDVAGVREDIYN